LFCLVILAIVTETALSQVHLTEPVSGEIVFERTEIRDILSGINSEYYLLWVSLPFNYHLYDTVYPVIYLMDSYRAFSITKGCFELFTFPTLLIPEM
jgi:hypothetical protein